VGTGDWVADIIRQVRNGDPDFAVVSNPEFLREGSAISDFLAPDRVVLGSLDREAAEKVAQLYLPLRTTIMITDLRTAEMIKYASNAFLATRISFINEIANICEALGADVKEVATGMGYDARIGHGYLDPGVGYGGSCFPKDVKALTYMAEIKGRHPQLLRAVMDINDDQRRQIVRKLDQALGGLRGKTIGLLGLAFKPNTDDMREAPAVHIARMLASAGARVRGYDPVARGVAERVVPQVELAEDAYDLARTCDALVVVTEWNEFKNLDLARIGDLMAGNVIIDGRNIYEPERMAALGFYYRGIGRGYEAA
jgi:UDPglucose 6-dehydrogenase